jgi:hypothetical protein
MFLERMKISIKNTKLLAPNFEVYKLTFSLQYLQLSEKKLRRMASSGVLRCVALVRTDVSEDVSASIIKVIRIGEVATLAVTNNRRTLLQEPQGVTSQKTQFFIVIAVKI